MDALPRGHDELNRRARDLEPNVRRAVAERHDAPPELLYYLAHDEAPAVRRAVAANPLTPRQADQLLARDPYYGVRVALADKLVGEGLSDQERQNLWRMGFTILETLVTDQVVRVRRALAEGFQHLLGAPRPIVLQLARDPEPEVAAPLLRNSPALDEADIDDLLRSGERPWAVEAIASRNQVTQGIARGVVERGHAGAVKVLLENQSADISDDSLGRIVERAEARPEWHEPLVRRPSLPRNAIAGLARFIAAPLLAILRARNDVDAALDAEIVRAAAAPPGKVHQEEKAEPSSGPANRPARAKRLFSERGLTDEAVSAALNSGERDFVVTALALRAGITESLAKRILGFKTARPVIALCWKAGLSMRFAMEVQMRIARIPPLSIPYARNGTDYPMSPVDMAAQLAFFAD